MRISTLLFLFSVLFSCGEIEQKKTIPKTGEVKRNQIPIKSEKQDTAIIYKVVEHMPRFKNCDPPTSDKDEAKKCSDLALIKYINKNLRFPLDAKENTEKDFGVVRFIVNEDGSVSDVISLREFVAEESFVEIVENMPKWEKPGIRQGVPVKVSFTLPLRIKLSF